MNVMRQYHAIQVLSNGIALQGSIVLIKVIKRFVTKSKRKNIVFV